MSIQDQEYNLDSENNQIDTNRSDKRALNLIGYTKKAFKTKNLLVREFLAEIISTFLLITFGCGSVAQKVLGGKDGLGTTLSINFSWGLGVTAGILVGGKVSGAHMNPAVSLTQVLLGKMSIIKFIIYLIGQSIGAFLGSVVVYIVYIDELNAFDGGTRCTTCANATAGIWATYPREELTIRGGFFDQFFGTALLVLVILAVTDSKNAEIPHGLVALLIGSTIFLIGMSFGLNCGYALNPVRDFIPRVFTSISGWGTEVYTAYDYFFWIPIVGPFAGAIFSTFLYAIFIENHWPETE